VGKKDAEGRQLEQNCIPKRRQMHLYKKKNGGRKREELEAPSKVHNVGGLDGVDGWAFRHAGRERLSHPYYQGGGVGFFGGWIVTLGVG